MIRDDRQHENIYLEIDVAASSKRSTLAVIFEMSFISLGADLYPANKCYVSLDKYVANTH